MLTFLNVLFWGFCGYLAVDYIVCTVHNHRVRKEQRNEEIRKQEVTRAMAIEREMSKQEQEEARLARVAAREAAQEEKLRRQRLAASSEMEYNNHRSEQLLQLIEIAELNQSGTVYGGKEWLKYQKQIMSYESQLQTLKTRRSKAMAIREA